MSPRMRGEQQEEHAPRVHTEPGAGPNPGSNGQVLHVDWAKVEQHANWLKSAADLPSGFSAKGRAIIAHRGSIKALNDSLKEAGLLSGKPYKSQKGVSYALTAIFKRDQRFTIEEIAAALLCKLDCNKYITTRQAALQRAMIEQLLQRSFEPDQSNAGEPNWRERRRGDDSPLPSMHNARLGIVAMGIECRHDLFRDVTIINFAGDTITHEVKPLIGELTNAALLQLRSMFSDRFGFDVEDKHILDAVKTLAFKNCFDPILDMLAEAEADWDGVERLDAWVVTYLNCEGTELNSAVGRKVLIAGVRRARVPGCKFDNITTLESPEGWDKSTAVRTLSGDDFFSDQGILGARDKEVQEQLAGVWMHENADLTGLSRADIEHVKAFASRQTDRARPAYGRVVEKKPRRSIEWATTNDTEYLQSQTGNRRFWPLPVGRIDIEALRRDRLLLLGEAAKYESAGEAITLDEALWPDAEDEQEKRRIKDPWEDIVADVPYSVTYTDAMLTEHTTQLIYGDADDVAGHTERVASADLLMHLLRIPAAQQKDYYGVRLAKAMKRAGWQRASNGKVTINKKQVRGYFRLVDAPSDDQQATASTSANTPKSKDPDDIPF
jgi:hypothetical protein